jgi:hypothetical protein
LEVTKTIKGLQLGVLATFITAEEEGRIPPEKVAEISNRLSLEGRRKL